MRGNFVWRKRTEGAPDDSRARALLPRRPAEGSDPSAEKPEAFAVGDKQAEKADDREDASEPCPRR